MEDSSKRAQMNPHFIFNALNGMQSILLLQGEQKANQYLGMLSKLLRYVRYSNPFPTVKKNPSTHFTH